MKKFNIAAAVAAGCLCMATSAGAAIFELDRLTIIKNGGDMFDDEFNDGFPPPSAPNFANGTTASYFVNGTVTESNDRLQIDTAGGDLVTGSSGINFTRTRVGLQTNVSNDEADLDRGLKDDDTFTFTALFDIDAPTRAFASFEARLNDGTPTNPANDILALRVTRTDTGDLEIHEYLDRDGAGPLFNLMNRWTLDDSNEQIALRFEKTSDVSKQIATSYAYVNGGVFGSWTSGTGAELFTDERFTRVQVQAWSPVPLPAAAWLFIGALGMLGMRARRRT